MKEQTMNKEATEVFALWNSLEDSKHWGEVEYINQCTSRPEWVWLGNNTNGEMYALLDIKQRRVIPEDEVTSQQIIEELEWETVYYVPTFKEAAKLYKTAAGPDFVKPDKTLSTHQRGAWLLNASDKRLLAIVRDDETVLHGPVLNAFFRQMSAGLPAPKIAR